MHLKTLKVENFRSLKKIDVEFDSLISVIIGPNAVGKTTVLEAIRLSRAILAPRTPNESNQVLQSLGATSPHMPQQLMASALTTNPSNPLIINSTYNLELGELVKIRESLPRLVPIVAQQNIGLTFATPAQVIAFFGSPAGQNALLESKRTLENEIIRVESSGSIQINLTIDFQTSQITGEYPAQQTFLGALGQDLSPNLTSFSYFPADRALPTGEQPVQFGSADASQQMESYNSQPALKYQRLKNFILSSILRNSNGRAELDADFRRIFNKILKGRELGEVVANRVGLFSIPIRDVESGLEFELDGLSSGEKGLILTFLLIARTLVTNGMILLDEPELHLNPAVCRDLLQFLVDEFAEKENIQAIICSHSAEIMTATFERNACSLFHLRDGVTLAKVRHSDQGEIRDALRRLGSSESEALMYKGTISVEGIHDIEILQTGYDDILRRFRLRQLGGRGQIEKDIKELQKGELAGEEIGRHFFVFDRDDKPTSLVKTDKVRFLQLSRTCLENFVLDADILTDLSRNRDFSDVPQATVTDMRQRMREIALRQLDEAAARIIFKDEGLESVCFDMSAMRQPTGQAITDALSNQLDDLSTMLSSLRQEDFRERFLAKFTERRRTLEIEWDDRWRELCNGKRLLEDMRQEGLLKGDLLRVKRAIMAQMKTKRTESYNSLEASLQNLIRD